MQSANPHLEVELNESSRSGGRVAYQMLIRLKENAPVGYLHDELTIVTDDSRRTRIPLNVEGSVISTGVTVSPSQISLGILQPNESVTKNMIVKAQEPFKVLSVKCKDGCFQFKTSEESKKLHIIPVTFTGTETPGAVEQAIEIETDFSGGTAVTCVATVTITSSDSES